MNAFFKPDTRVKLHGRDATLYPAGEKHTTVIFDDGDPQTVETKILQQAYEEYDLAVQAAGSEKPLASAILNQSRLNKQIRHSAYINHALRQKHIFSRRLIQASIDAVRDELGDPTPPGVSTLIAWVKKHLEEHGKIDATESFSDNKRKRGKRLDRRIYQLIYEVIDDFFLTLRSLSIWQCFEEFRKRLFKLFPERSSERLPHKSTFYKCIYELCPIERTLKRKGKGQARKLSRTALKQMRAVRILQHVQMDAVHLNLPLYTDEGKFLGYPVIHFAIDLHSRAIIGFSIEIGSESAAGVIACIQSMLQQRGKSAELLGTRNDWIMFGKMEQVGTDGGPAYIANVVCSLFATMGISRQVNQAYTPWHKAVIERFNRTLRTNLHLYSRVILAEMRNGIIPQTNIFRKKYNSLSLGTF